MSAEKTLIVIGVPRGFPCALAALHSLQQAHAHGCTRIEIDRPPHRHEFSTSELWGLLHEMQLRPREIHVTPTPILERRLQVWPGGGFPSFGQMKETDHG